MYGSSMCKNDFFILVLVSQFARTSVGECGNVICKVLLIEQASLGIPKIRRVLPLYFSLVITHHK